jgi:hypothetical protein
MKAIEDDNEELRSNVNAILGSIDGDGFNRGRRC